MFRRRRLPHWVPDHSFVFVTWRLAGTLPQPAPEMLTGDQDPGRTFLLQDRQLDSIQLGPRWLRDPPIADLFVEAPLHGDTIRREYDLFAWVVMPNHVHLLLKPNGTLSETMRWLKTGTAVRANRRLGKTGEAFWQREYYDRWIRSEKEFASVVAYMEANPVKAGLVGCPEKWRWSSAWKNTGGETAGATEPSKLVI